MTAVMERAGTWSTTSVAAWLRIPYKTVHHWIDQIHRPRPGSGGRIRLDRVDVLTLYAWTQVENREHRRLMTLAIRERPALCVVILGPGRACTVDTWEAAVRLAFDLGRGHMRWCVDLTPAWEWTEPRA